MATRQKTARVRDALLKAIRRGQAGDQLTPELRLKDQYRVSLVTVRRAIKQLVDEGYLYRVQGSGTFIRRRTEAGVPANGKIAAEGFFTAPADTAARQSDEARFSFMTNPDRWAIYSELKRRFADDFPDFDVTLDPRKAVSTQAPDFFYEIEKGVAPDLFDVNRQHLFWLIKNRYIAPLDGYLEKDPAFPLDLVDPMVREACRYRGATWMLPRNAHVFYLCYNKALFDAAKVPYPNEEWTWETYLAAAREIQGLNQGRDENARVYGVAPHRDYLYLAPLVWAFGGDFVDKNGEVALLEPATLEALRFAVDLVMKHGVTQPPAEWDWGKPGSAATNEMSLFQEGRLAMLLAGGTDKAKAFENAPGLDWDIALAPKGPAGRFTPVMFSGFVMSSIARAPEMTARLIKFFAGPEAAARYAQIEMPALNAEAALEAFFSQPVPKHRFCFLSMKNYAREFSFGGHYWPYLSGRLFDALREIYLRDAPFERTLKNVTAGLRTAMEQYLRWENEK